MISPITLLDVRLAESAIDAEVLHKNVLASKQI
jgi:hypothetical protein